MYSLFAPALRRCLKLYTLSEFQSSLLIVIVDLPVLDGYTFALMP
jgi:hypothetical protein